MKRFSARIVTLFVATVVSLCCVSVAFAVEDNIDGTETKAAYYNSAIANISISGGSAIAVGKVIGNNATTKITIKLNLQKKSNGTWTTVASWSGTKAGKDYKLTKSKNASRGTYRTAARERKSLNPQKINCMMHCMTSTPERRPRLPLMQ